MTVTVSPPVCRLVTAWLYLITIDVLRLPAAGTALDAEKNRTLVFSSTPATFPMPFTIGLFKVITSG